MHEYRSPALKRLNCLLSEMDAAYHEAALRQGLNDSSSRILYALCELGSPASLRAVCESTGLSKQTVNSALRKLEAEGIFYLEPSGARSKRLPDGGGAARGRCHGRPPDPAGKQHL